MLLASGPTGKNGLFCVIVLNDANKRPRLSSSKHFFFLSKYRLGGTQAMGEEPTVTICSPGLGL